MRLTTLLALALALLLSACAKQDTIREELAPDGRVAARTFTGGSVDYARYLEAAKAPQAAGVDATACQGDARCVENVAAFAALAQVAGGNRTNIAPPQQARTFGDRVESVLKTAVSVLPGLGGQYVALKSSDNSRDVALAQYGFLGGVVQDMSAASVAVAQSGPRIDVGGDYVGGNNSEVDIGDHFTGGDRSETNVGGDQVGGDQHIGDTVGGDQAGGDIIDNGGVIGNDNDTRFGSPGPIDVDNSDNGDCDGEGGCNNGGGFP